MLIKSVSRNEGLERVIKLFESGLPPLTLAPPPKDVRNSEWYLDYKLEGIVETLLLQLGSLPTLNGKAIPATRILIDKEEQGAFDNDPIVDLSSSGNFAASCGFLRKFFPIRQINAVIDRKVPRGKRKQLQFSGVNIVESPERVSPIEHAHELGKQPGHVEVNQYVELGSIYAQEWTASHISRCCVKLGKTPTMFGAVTGTKATVVGGKMFLSDDWPGIKVFGVASMYVEGDREDKEKVPGSRSRKGLSELEGIEGFELEKALDFELVTSVTKKRAFETNIGLIRDWLPVGPTGGLLVAGFYDLIRDICMGKHKDVTIDSVRNEMGQIVAVLPTIDMYLPYSQDPEYEEALSELV